MTFFCNVLISYGIDGMVWMWFRSYPSGRFHYIRVRAGTSPAILMRYGVPQGSVLGPILFLLYTADLAKLIESYGFNVHLYADDTQIYGFSSPSTVAQLQMRMSACIDDVSSWMSSNRLQLNASKTEVMWYTSPRRQSQLPKAPFRVYNDHVSPSTSVRDLGIYLDSDVSMRTQVSRTVSQCFGILRQLHTVRRSVSQSVFQSLVEALVLTKLDFGNATLVGIPSFLLDRLQAVMNAAARLVFQSSRYDHVTPLLHRLHWLHALE